MTDDKNTFLKLVEVFKNINEYINEDISVIVKIISTDVLIRKQNIDLSLMQVVCCDETGCVNMILKNELIKFVQIGKELILRSCKVSVIDGHIFIIADENTTIFDSFPPLIKPNMENLKLNFSHIKISKLEYELN